MSLVNSNRLEQAEALLREMVEISHPYDFDPHSQRWLDAHYKAWRFLESLAAVPAPEPEPDCNVDDKKLAALKAKAAMLDWLMEEIQPVDALTGELIEEKTSRLELVCGWLDLVDVMVDRELGEGYTGGDGMQTELRDLERRYREI